MIVLSFAVYTETPREMSLCGGQCPVWGWREAGRRSAEALWEVWLQGVFSPRSEPRCDHQLPLHHPSVPRAESLQGLPPTSILHWGTYTMKYSKQNVGGVMLLWHPVNAVKNSGLLVRNKKNLIIRSLLTYFFKFVTWADEFFKVVKKRWNHEVWVLQFMDICWAGCP